MFEIDLSHQKVASVLESASTVRNGMDSLINFCAEHESWRGWNPLRLLDFETDLTLLTSWLTKLLTKEPPPKSIKAYWFGLYNPVINGKTTCGLYAAGATDLDPDDDSFDWACGPAYFPAGRDAESLVLDSIYEKTSTARGNVPSYGEYVLGLGYAGLVVQHLARTVNSKLWLGSQAKRALAVGFDSGDGIFLGSITKKGWIGKAS